MMNKSNFYLLVSFLLFAGYMNGQSSLYNELNKIIEQNHRFKLPKNKVQISNYVTEFELDTKDSKGNDLTLVVWEISKNYNWIFKLTDSIENIPLDYLIKQIIPHIPTFKRCEHIVALGTASSEGNDSTELNRSLQRAKKIAVEIKNSNILSEKQCLYYFPLGRFTEVVLSKYTGDQRPLVIVGVKDYTNNWAAQEELEKVIRKALLNNKILSNKGRKYKNINEFTLLELN